MYYGNPGRWNELAQEKIPKVFSSDTQPDVHTLPHKLTRVIHIKGTDKGSKTRRVKPHVDSAAINGWIFILFAPFYRPIACVYTFLRIRSLSAL